MGVLKWAKKFLSAHAQTWPVGAERRMMPYHEMGRSIDSYSKEGYSKNVIVFRCVDIVSKAVGALPYKVMVGDEENENHPVAKLLEKPNPLQSKNVFLEGFCAFRLIGGNAYAEAVLSGVNVPVEMWVWPPSSMRVVGAKGSFIPVGYVWKSGSVTQTWDVDPISGSSNLLHWKTFNPLSLWYGMSPISAAVYDVDQHNEAGKWNARLLQNSAVPDGSLYTENTLTEDQYKRLRKQLEEKYQGPSNARRAMILEGGLRWEQSSISPKDMDWLNGKNLAARDIAGVFGVPTQVIPIQGDQTFANYEQARLALYEDTVVPLGKDLANELTRFLQPYYADQPRIVVDEDTIPALEEKRSKKWDSMKGAYWLTVNERREATGFDPVNVPEADEILIPSNLIPINVELPTGSPATTEGDEE